MRYWYLRLAVFLGALAVPAWWLYQAWIFALDLTRARPWSIDWGWAPWYCCYSPWR